VKSTLRLATTPRWIALGLIALIFAVAAVGLGRWQWDRTQDIVLAEVAAQAQAVDVETLTEVGEDFDNPLIGRPVLARGTYVANLQTAVLSRSVSDQPGVWVMAPLLLADGSAIAVVRGWAADLAEAQVPTGVVDIQGVWHPSERFYRDEPFRTDGVFAISSERLRDRWDLDLRPGFIMLTGQQPPSDLVPVPQTVQTAGVPFPVQNAFYAVQWLVFAGFAGFVYIRWLRMEARESD
jgi:cytochrome oxidase assembly protein ShyY1